MRSRALVAAPLAALLIVAACRDTGPVAQPSPSATPTPTPTPTPATSPVGSPPATPAFAAARAQAWVGRLAALGPREASGETYAHAARLVRRELARLGYAARLVPFDVPAGSVDGEAVGAGRSVNVVATVPGFDPATPHVVVGGHLDTVPDSPGANDNASGIGVMLELARLAMRHPPRIPLVFVAFGAEERRGQGSLYSFGSRSYVDGLGRAERRAVLSLLNLDMVGHGDRLTVVGAGGLFRHVLARARRLDVPAGPGTPGGLFSDHLAFEEAGIDVAWLWSGDHPSLHTPQDVASVVRRRDLRRVGTLAWDALRSFRG